MSTGRPATRGEFEVLTSPGPAAIAVIRVRGSQTEAFITRHVRLHHPQGQSAWQPGRVWRAELLDADGVAIDDILVSVHAALPTWDVRLHLHGNPWLVLRGAELLGQCGLQQCSPLRAETRALWTAHDALEAEAFILLPQMQTLDGARWLLGQVGRLRAAIVALIASGASDAARMACSEIAARLAIATWFSQSLRVVLAGPPNSGKSTLANALADRTVSLVSATPGTTRDWVEIPGEAAGFPLVWLDTAGLRASRDPLEQAGIERTHRLIQDSDAVVLVLDAADQAGSAIAAFVAAYGDLTPACIVLTKSDLPTFNADVRETLPESWRCRTLSVSAARHAGLDGLRRNLLVSIGRTSAALELPAAFTPRLAEVFIQAAANNHNLFNESMLQLIQPTVAT